MRKSKRFASMPVISLEEGQHIGIVKELVIDPAGKRVAALIIEQKGWFKEQRFIPYAKVHSVGADAITIEKSSGVQKAAGLPEIVKLHREKIKIAGARLVAENGTVLGNVDEYYVDIETGTIAGLEFSGNVINSVIKGRAFLDIAYVRTMGKEVIVVTNEAVENAFKLDGGLQETIKNVRESTGHLWESTMQKTREFGTSLNKSLEKVKKEIKRMDLDDSEIFEDIDDGKGPAVSKPVETNLETKKKPPLPPADISEHRDNVPPPTP
ncbi:PRC-barrel domain-containing protein [Pelotomaculum propionicicum]|uniref:PRC-barrel domain-containing protein n=1 Tax=Pelotomaculum propionicicum TaxID=258475 RepID=A0A4Y7RTQ1_9FIRM|nr:PRC-barrel domain-containing protein [Pelotomaculum propionicicum]NLI12829.1 photosystem reaction center subunit H [Peptococcaceae bacterium]TEB12251.1 hypothetical protein Pmgp_01142 [Pelotomaculum propionicicum]